MKKFLLLIMCVFMVSVVSGCDEQKANTNTNSSSNADSPNEISSDNTENSNLLTEDEALELAKEYWEWEEYTENGELVNYKSTQIFPHGELVSGYYNFTLKWWVDDHWSTIDEVNVNKETGECTYTTN